MPRTAHAASPKNPAGPITTSRASTNGEQESHAVPQHAQLAPADAFRVRIGISTIRRSFINARALIAGVKCSRPAADRAV